MIREMLDIRPHCFVLIALAGYLIASSALMVLHAPQLLHTIVFCIALAGASWASWRAVGLRITMFWGAIFALTAVMADRLADVSYDGLHYHLPASLEIARGLNIYYEESASRWVNIYPSGAWRIVAAVMGLHDFLTPSIILNIYFAGVSGILLLALFDGASARHWRYLCILFMFAAFSPVVIGQMSSAMLDGAVCSMYLILVTLLAIDYRKPYPLTSAAACAAAIILFSLKTSGMVFVAFAFGIMILAILLLERRLSSRIVLIGAVSVVISVAVNYKPFFTNIAAYGSPAPDVGELIGSQRPSNIRDAGRLLQIASAVFAETGLSACCDGDARFKVPGLISFRELREAKTGPRSGGFGPFFGLIAILAIGIFSYYARKGMGKTEKMASTIAIGTLVVCVVFPEPWSARYIPMLAPSMLLLIACVLPHVPRPILWITLVAIVLNSAIFVANIASAQIAIYKLSRQFKSRYPLDGFSLQHQASGLSGYALSVSHVVRKMGYRVSGKSCQETTAFYHEVPICFDGQLEGK